MADQSSSTPHDDLPVEAAQLAEHFDERERELAARESQLAEARAALRRDRDKFAEERAESDRTKSEAADSHRQIERKLGDIRVALEAERAAVEESRRHIESEATRLEKSRAEFHDQAAEVRDRLRVGWAGLEDYRTRTAAEWTDANAHVARREAAIEARLAEVAKREKAITGAAARVEKDTAGLRTEAGGLEARIQHARGVVEELEQKRDRLRAELLALARPADVAAPGVIRIPLDRAADRDLAQWGAELDALDRRLAQEKENLHRVKAGLERDTVDLADRRRIVAEQFVMLGAARAEWQDAERRTVAEMEDLANGLRLREEDLAAREERLGTSDFRRREDAEVLWRLRLRLDAWQAKLAAAERRWQEEWEQRMAEHAAQGRALAERQAALLAIAGRWERARSEEQEHLRTELRLWGDDRARLARAADVFDRRTREVVAELTTHAARAMASEDLLAEVAGKNTGTTRRFDVLRKRWDRVFKLKLDEIDARRATAAADFARLDDRYAEVQQALAELAEREAGANTESARDDAVILGDPAAFAALGATTTTPRPSYIVELRDEVERLAEVLTQGGIPALPDEELPWAGEEVQDEEPNVLAFTWNARAA